MEKVEEAIKGSIKVHNEVVGVLRTIAERLNAS